jgi:hypothetical protein
MLAFVNTGGGYYQIAALSISFPLDLLPLSLSLSLSLLFPRDHGLGDLIKHKAKNI